MTATREHLAGLELALELYTQECQPLPFTEVLCDLIDQAHSAEPVQGEAVALDQRLEAAGMLSVAKLLQGAPIDAFLKHAGVNDIASLLQWAEMRRGEYLRMQARYDLGERDKGDDLYEWVVAHCAVFPELHVNIRAAAKPDAELVELLRDARRCVMDCADPDAGGPTRREAQSTLARIDAKLAELEK